MMWAFAVLRGLDEGEAAVLMSDGDFDGLMKGLVGRAEELTQEMNGQQIVYCLNAVAVADLPGAGQLVELLQQQVLHCVESMGGPELPISAWALAKILTRSSNARSRGRT
jgi:hypothetical protein